MVLSSGIDISLSRRCNLDVFRIYMHQQQCILYSMRHAVIMQSEAGVTSNAGSKKRKPGFEITSAL